MVPQDVAFGQGCGPCKAYVYLTFQGDEVGEDSVKVYGKRLPCVGTKTRFRLCSMIQDLHFILSGSWEVEANYL